MSLGRSSSLSIDGDSSAIACSGRTGGVFDRSAGAELRDALEVPLLPLDKGKGKVNLIKYVGGGGGGGGVRIPKICSSACFNCGT